MDRNRKRHLYFVHTILVWVHPFWICVSVCACRPLYTYITPTFFTSQKFFILAKNHKMARSVRKTKSVRAPQGFHWMRKGVNRYKLMRHKGAFVPHPGASLIARFEIQEQHKDG